MRCCTTSGRVDSFPSGALAIPTLQGMKCTKAMQETNIRTTTKRRSKAYKERVMNRYLAVFFTVVLAVICIAVDANAQAAAAKMHVDAAKAAIAAKDNNPKVAPFHNYQ